MSRKTIEENISKQFVDKKRFNCKHCADQVVQHNLFVMINEILDDYTDFLIKNGYMDTDAVFEEPKAVERFLKQ